jgi:phosphoglycolate phosphatase-like HAD superfamily hydrolase
MSARAAEAWVFDLDGTLVESRLRLYGAYVGVAGEFDLPVLSPSELRTAIHERTLEAKLGLDRPRAEVILAAWYAAFGANTPASPPFAGAADALRACSRTGARVAIATARPTPASVVSAELHEVGLGQLIDVISTTESVGGPLEQVEEMDTVLEGYLTKKRQIIAALEELDVPASRAAMASDEAFDLTEAAELGIPRLVGVLGGNSDRRAFAETRAQVLDSVADLPRALGVGGWPLRLGEAVSRGSRSP